MPIINGVVEAKSNKFDKFSILVGASSIRPAAPAATGFPVPMNTKDRSIVRQNALARGAEVACAAHEPGASAEDIAREAIRLARLFEDYTSGDADVREAKALTAATVDVAA
jgi:hypothetical protein